MHAKPRKPLLFALAAIALFAALLSAQSGRSYGPGLEWWSANQRVIFPLEEDYDNPNGSVRILNKSGNVNPENHAFFEALGTNGRACVTCHQPSDAMSLSSASLRKRWSETNGHDAVFAAIDGSNCPSLPQTARASHSLLLDRGLFRIQLPWPPENVQPEFTIETVRNVAGCRTKDEGLISVYRRPRMVANFQNSSLLLMTDGREPGLREQAITAARVHEQAAKPPTEEQLHNIVEFENQVFAAQRSHIRGGLLATGTQTHSLFAGWAPGGDSVADFRASAARGSQVFERDCVQCHTPGKVKALDIGTTKRDDPDLPLFRVTCKSTGKSVLTSDPGRALITGKCIDVGSVITQQLRGLSARAPYFVNGSAKTLDDVVDYYDRQFSLSLSNKDKQDLVNFLSVL